MSTVRSHLPSLDQTETVPPCVDRRAFLAQGSLAAVAAVLATACGTGALGGPSGPGSVNLAVTLADYSALNTVGGIARISGSTPIAVVRAAATSYRAFYLVCPHQGATVGAVSGGFRCPEHQATWNASGAWTGGQRTSNLYELTCTLNAAGTGLTITA